MNTSFKKILKYSFLACTIFLMFTMKTAAMKSSEATCIYKDSPAFFDYEGRDRSGKNIEVRVKSKDNYSNIEWVDLTDSLITYKFGWTEWLSANEPGGWNYDRKFEGYPSFKDMLAAGTITAGSKDTLCPKFMVVGETTTWSGFLFFWGYDWEGYWAQNESDANDIYNLLRNGKSGNGWKYNEFNGPKDRPMKLRHFKVGGEEKWQLLVILPLYDTTPLTKDQALILDHQSQDAGRPSFQTLAEQLENKYKETTTACDEYEDCKALSDLYYNDKSEVTNAYNKGIEKILTYNPNLSPPAPDSRYGYEYLKKMTNEDLFRTIVKRGDYTRYNSQVILLKDYVDKYNNQKLPGNNYTCNEDPGQDGCPEIYEYIKKYQDALIADAKDRKWSFNVIDLMFTSMGLTSGSALACSDFCDEVDGAKVNILASLFDIMKIAAPILVIVLGSLDFVKAVLAEDQDALKKAGKRFSRRLMAAILLFFIPTIISALLKVAQMSAIVQDAPEVCVDKDIAKLCE